MGMLWDIVQAHIDSSPYPPSERQVAGKLGISPTALSNWKAPKRLPDVENLRALAILAGVPYSRVLEAALVDTGYKKAGGGHAQRSASMNHAGQGSLPLPGTQSDLFDEPLDPDDVMLAARDADDDAEAEAQQEEP